MSLGTTSACAENTKQVNVDPYFLENYLRARGEYANGKDAWVNSLELPPRARRILNSVKVANLGIGTTSACAENTS